MWSNIYKCGATFINVRPQTLLRQMAPHTADVSWNAETHQHKFDPYISPYIVCYIDYNYSGRGQGRI